MKYQTYTRRLKHVFGPIVTRAAVPVILLCMAPGCAQPPAKVTTLSEAHKKFLTICDEERHLKPLIKPQGKTLYIYLPVEHEIMVTKPNGKEAFQSPMAKSAQKLLFIDGRHDKNQFSFTYDVAEQKFYPNELGYTYVYSDAYRQKDSFLLQALLRAYGDLDAVSIDALESSQYDKPLAQKDTLDFVVLVIADINNGMVATKTFYFRDYRYSLTGALPAEEYIRRQLFEVTGNVQAVDDTTGRHLKYHEITWREFLTRQIVHRVKFQYQRSDFPPKDDPENAILGMAYEAFKAYTYKDFDTIELNNLAEGKTYLFNKRQLETFKE